MKQEDIVEIRYALSRLTEDTKTRVALTLNSLANNYFTAHQEACDRDESLMEHEDIKQLAEAGMLFFVLAEACMYERNLSGRSSEAMSERRMEHIFWGEHKYFDEHLERYQLLYEAVYDDLMITFGVPLTHGEIHPSLVGYVKMIWRREGEKEKVFSFHMDRNAILDWQLGLAFVAGRELRSPFTELVLSETGEDDENERDSNNTAA